MAGIPSAAKRYSVPLILFALGLFFQLVVLPNSFPTSHYDVLGVKRFASVEEVTEAYNKLSSQWLSGSSVPTASQSIEICYAFELLTNPIWKRDYDLFGIDEQLHVSKKAKEQYQGEDFSKIKLPLLDAISSDPIDQASNLITAENFVFILNATETLLIQVYSVGSHSSAKFSKSWQRIATLLDGVADIGMVELGDVHLASYLAERKSTKQPFFRKGLPALVAFPPNCKKADCCVRYHGDLSVDAVVDWMATSILGLPRILYYSRETLVDNFILKSGPHKVKVIFFSNTGERAVPTLRQAVRNYWAYASFGMVLWRKEEYSLWWNMFHVESAPATVFIKDPGVEPVVYHGNLNNSYFLEIMEKNKHHELQQLRSITSMQLGCNAKGFSRAGVDTATWYCAILAGRPSLELNRMRETVRRAQRILIGDVNSDSPNEDKFPVPTTAATAFKGNRLTFAWLDGEAQKDYCLFYLSSENAYETCGPRNYSPTDVPRLFIVRYRRDMTNNKLKAKKKFETFWDTFQEEDANAASQLVAKYNGSDDIQEIIQWISQIIEDGDAHELTSYSGKVHELIPEDAEPIWSKAAQGILSSGVGTKQKIQSTITDISDHLRDPRVGSLLLLAACLLFGTIWLRGSQTSRPAEKDEGATTRRAPRAERSNIERPSSITDMEPKDAYQILPSDSDSDSE